MNTERTGRRTPALGIAGALILVALAACGDAQGSAHPVQPRLTGGASELEALGSAVWAGVVAGDTAALRRLRLTEYEHDELVWPEQPAAAEASAAENLDFWWQNIQRRNRAALDDLLTRFGGSDLALTGVECPGPVREYATFQALTDCQLVLRGPEGPRRLQAFRYVIRMDGVHKVVRYYDG